ncbi:MAG: hypothetical protein ACKV2V_27630 [Blastocatellia bacterium]
MIQSLRKRHYLMLHALAIAAPLLFIAGLVVRRDIPASTALPAPRENQPVSGAAVVDEANLWQGASLRTRVLPANNGFVLELQPATDLDAPDVLLYWSAQAGDGQPNDAAILLGTLHGHQTTRFPLPARVAAGGGQLALYSLAHRRTLATAALPAFPVKGGAP